MGSSDTKEAEKQNPGFLGRWLPHPFMTLVLVLLWIALENSLSLPNVLFAVLLGILIPIYTSHFWPKRPKIRSPFQAMIFIVILIWDIAIANIQVAYLILFRKPENLRSGWVSIPLDIKTPEAITALAATITLTPGTVSSDLSTDGRYLLVHCLDIDDAEEIVSRIKTRYEARLEKVFP